MLRQPSGPATPDPVVHTLRTHVAEARRQLDLLQQQLSALAADLDRSVANTAKTALPGMGISPATAGSGSAFRSASLPTGSSQTLAQLDQEVQDFTRRFTSISNVLRTKRDAAKNSIDNVR